MDKVDIYVKGFCAECLEVLRYYDNKIRENLVNSINNDFYEYMTKGISVWSITEPILKFLIFSSLSKKYMIWPEVGEYYNDRKLLDLALYLPEEYTNNDVTKEDESEPDIAIEMKWGGLKKTGEFKKWGLDNFIDDILKLHKQCLIKNKYVMQFVIINNETTDVNTDLLRAQILDSIDKRRFRSRDIEAIYDDYFETYGVNMSEKWKFFIITWRII